MFSGSAESGHIGGAVEVKGNGKTLRGVCVLGSDDPELVYLERRWL